MTRILKQGETATIRFVESLIHRSTGARLTTSATVRVCSDGTWGDGAGTLSVDETDQWRYTLHASEAAARNLEVAIDHADAIGPIGGAFTLLSAGAYDIQVRGQQTNEHGGKVWWVDDGGNDANDGFSLATAKLTLSSVVTAATDGDTIRVGPGTIALSAGLSTPKRLIWEGHRSTSIISASTAIDMFKPGNGSIIRHLRFVHTSTNSNAKVIDLTGRHFITLEHVVIDTAEAVPLLVDNSTEITLREVQATTTANVYAIHLYGDQNETGVLESSVRTERCRFYGLKAGAYVEDRTRLYDDGSEFKGQYAGTVGALVAGIQCDTHTFQGPRIHLVGTKLVAIASHAGFSGDVCGVTSWRDGSDTAVIRGFVDGGSVELSNGGSGNTFDFDVHNAGSLLIVRGCAHNRSRNSGAQVQVIDKDVAAALASTESVQSYLPATGPLPNAQQIAIVEAAVQPQQFRDAMRLAPSVGTAAANSIDRKIDDIEAGGGGGGRIMPVNQSPVPLTRMWKLKYTDDGLVGELPLIVQKSAGNGKLYALDFSADLATNGRVIDINAVTLLSGTEGGITFGEDLADANDYGCDRAFGKVRIGLVESGVYKFRVSVSFDDSDGGGTSEGDVILVVKP